MGRPLLCYKDVIKRDLRSTPLHGRTSLNTEIHGGKVSKWGFQRRKQTLESRLRAREQRRKNAQPLCVFPQGTSAPPATETATPGLGYTVLQDPAQILSANHRLLETRMLLLHTLSIILVQNNTLQLDLYSAYSIK